MLGAILGGHMAMTRYQREQEKNTKLQKRLRDLNSKLKNSKMPSALTAGGLVLGGAAASGALKSFAGDELAGIDTGIIGGLVSGTAGVALSMPALVSLGAGMMAPYIADYVQDTVSDMMNKDNTVSAGPRAVNQ